MNEKEAEQHREAEEAAEKAAKQGVLNRLIVATGQKIGVIERTKLTIRFEKVSQAKINRLVTYHNTIYDLIESLETQIQVDPRVLAARKLKCDAGKNPWEVIGGWMAFLSLAHFDGHEAVQLKRFSSTCGKIGRKETEAQGNSRTHWLKKMRAYTASESDDLNTSVEQMKVLLTGIDDSRLQLHRATTCKEARTRGEAYGKMIRAFNAKAGDVQSMIDELPYVFQIHELEMKRFSKELARLHDTTYNMLHEARLRAAWK